MMKARLAGLILLMGASMAAQAHHHNTFALDDEAQEFKFAMRLAGSSYRDAFAGFERGRFLSVHNVRDADGDFDGCPGPIPEPGTYAMLLAGLGLMTTIARRKRLDR